MLISKYKKIGVLTAIACMSVSLIGCGDKTVMKQKAEIKQLKATIESQTATISQLNEDIKGLGITEVKHDSSLKEVEGSKVPVFETIDGKIVFPTKLEMPNSTEAANNSNIMIGNKYKFTPSNNWMMRLQGSTLELSHPSKVWGNMKAITIANELPSDMLKTLLQGFYKKFPATTITYRDVFIDGRNSGMMSKAPITVDDKPYVVNVGVIQKGEYAMLLLFASEEDGTGVQQELIDLLISSGQYGDYKISLE